MLNLWVLISIAGGGSHGTSPGPRPLSKVRTSFVAVERSGQFGAQIGLKRSDSIEERSSETRRPAFSIDEHSHPQEIAERQDTITTEFESRKLSNALEETIPESALETPVSETLRPGLTPRTSYMNGKRATKDVVPAESNTTGNIDKTTSVEGKNKKLVSGDSKITTAGNSNSVLNGSGGFGETLNGNTDGKGRSSEKSTEKSTPARGAAKPAPISTSKTSTSTKPFSKSAKSPATPKTPTTPGKSTKSSSARPAAPSQSKDQTKTSEPKPAKPMAPISNTKPARPSTASSAGTTASKKLPHQSPASTFNKPRPRSPTRPAKLPASMTAPTASSLSKINGPAPPPRQSLAPSNGTNAQKTIARSQSRSSIATNSDRPSLAPKELRRTKSTIGKVVTAHDRPALGRPPVPSLQKQPARQSLPKQTDEGFLARMMRPTTASAQKTHDKTVTPPRSKPTTRPVTRDGSIAKPFDGSPVSKKHPPVPQIPKIEEPKFTTPDAEVTPTAKVVSAVAPKDKVTPSAMENLPTAVKPAAKSVTASTESEVSHSQESPISPDSANNVSALPNSGVPDEAEISTVDTKSLETVPIVDVSKQAIESAEEENVLEDIEEVIAAAPESAEAKADEPGAQTETETELPTEKAAVEDAKTLVTATENVEAEEEQSVPSAPVVVATNDSDIE
jgi:hypothetical protein